MKSLLILLVSASAVVLGGQGSDRLRVIVIDGDEAANIVAERIAAEPVVEVREDDERRVAGAVVRFFVRRTVRNRIAALFSNGQSEATALTDAAGRAQAPPLMPLEPGSYEIEVQVSHQGRTATATIRQTNYVTAAEAQNVGPTTSTSGGSGAAPAGAASSGIGAAAAGGGLSKLAVIGIVAGGAAGGGAAAALARRDAGARTARITSVTPSVTSGVQAVTAFTFGVQIANFDAGSLSYRWEFGDGRTSDAPEPTHLYDAPGTYTVVVTVSDNGHSVQSETTVTVYTMTGTWISQDGGILEVTQSGGSLLAFNTFVLSPGTPVQRNFVRCLQNGSVQAGVPIVVVFEQIPCRATNGALLEPVDYRFTLGADGQTLTGTGTGRTSQAPRQLVLRRQ